MPYSPERSQPEHRDGLKDQVNIINGDKYGKHPGVASTSRGRDRLEDEVDTIYW